MPETARVLSSLQIAVAQQDVVDDNGKILARAGDAIIIVPQTVSQAVLVEKGRTLAEAWPTISRVGHGHEDLEGALASYQAELIRLADRITKMKLDNNGDR